MLLVNQGPADLQVPTERHVPAKHKFNFAAVCKKPARRSAWKRFV